MLSITLYIYIDARHVPHTHLINHKNHNIIFVFTFSDFIIFGRWLSDFSRRPSDFGKFGSDCQILIYDRQILAETAKFSNKWKCYLHYYRIRKNCYYHDQQLWMIHLFLLLMIVKLCQWPSNFGKLSDFGRWPSNFQMNENIICITIGVEKIAIIMISSCECTFFFIFMIDRFWQWLPNFGKWLLDFCRWPPNFQTNENIITLLSELKKNAIIMISSCEWYIFFNWWLSYFGGDRQIFKQMNILFALLSKLKKCYYHDQQLWMIYIYIYIYWWSSDFGADWLILIDHRKIFK